MVRWVTQPKIGGEGVKPYQPSGMWKALSHPPVIQKITFPIKMTESTDGVFTSIGKEHLLTQ